MRFKLQLTDSAESATVVDLLVIIMMSLRTKRVSVLKGTVPAFREDIVCSMLWATLPFLVQAIAYDLYSYRQYLLQNNLYFNYPYPYGFIG